VPRRRKAKIPDEVVLQAKPRLATALCEQAAGWEIKRGPVLGDCAYGDDTAFSHGPARAGARVRARRFGADRRLRARDDLRGARAHARARPAAERRAPGPQQRVGGALAERLPAEAWQTVPCRTTPAGEIVDGRFAFVARLPPLRAGHLRTRLPHARTDLPKSAAAGLTLPQVVLLMQPLLRCWDGHCRSCHQPVDLAQLVLFPDVSNKVLPSSSRRGAPALGG
jgi:hypothetical protein